MKIGFIGVGNMAGAMIEGLLKADASLVSSFFIFSKHYQNLENLQAQGINVCESAEAVMQAVEVVFLGVKPEDLEALAVSILPFVKDVTLVSMAAKTTLDQLKNYFKTDNIIRIMPNLNVSVNKGVIAIVKTESIRDFTFTYVISMLSKIGHVYELEEHQISAFIAGAGSSPAFVYRFILKLAEAVHGLGIPLEQALEIVSLTLEGSAIYQRESKQSCEALIRNVSSAKGTTIEGLKALDEHGFDKAIKAAALAVFKRDQQG